MAKLASTVYGEALFQIAVEKKRVDGVMEEITAVRKALEENTELAALMNHPKIIREEKVRLIESCFKGQVSEDVTGFLTVVVSKGRFAELPAIFDYLTARMKEHKKIGVVTVTAPMELTDGQKEKIREKILATTDYKTLEVTWLTDPSLMGGLVIRIGDRVVDSSLKYKLEQLRGQLLAISLEEKNSSGGKASMPFGRKEERR